MDDLFQNFRQKRQVLDNKDGSEDGFFMVGIIMEFLKLVGNLEESEDK